jgi:hypothetical protein
MSRRDPRREASVEHAHRPVPEVVEHPPEASGDPPAHIVVGNDAVCITDPGGLQPSDERRCIGEWMPPRPDLGRVRQVPVDVEEDGAGHMPRLVTLAAHARLAEHPPAVDHADRWVGEPGGELRDRPSMRDRPDQRDRNDSRYESDAPWARIAETNSAVVRTPLRFSLNNCRIAASHAVVPIRARSPATKFAALK